MALGVPCKKNAVFATGTFNVLISSIGDVPSLTALTPAFAGVLRFVRDSALRANTIIPLHPQGRRGRFPFRCSAAIPSVGLRPPNSIHRA